MDFEHIAFELLWNTPPNTSPGLEPGWIEGTTIPYRMSSTELSAHKL